MAAIDMIRSGDHLQIMNTDGSIRSSNPLSSLSIEKQIRGAVSFIVIRRGDTVICDVPFDGINDPDTGLQFTTAELAMQYFTRIVNEAASSFFSTAPTTAIESNGTIFIPAEGDFDNFTTADIQIVVTSLVGGVNGARFITIDLQESLDEGAYINNSGLALTNIFQDTNQMIPNVSLNGKKLRLKVTGNSVDIDSGFVTAYIKATR